MIRLRPHSFTTWSRFVTGAWLAGCLGFAWVHAEDPRRNAKQSVEWAYYLLRIEADTALAEHVLQEMLHRGGESSSIDVDPVARARAQCLVGEIKAARGDKASAIAHFKQALADTRLPKGERAQVIRKVMRIDPTSITSLDSLPPTPGKVMAVQHLRMSQDHEALIEIAEAKTNGRRLLTHDRKGRLHSLSWGLSATETVLDAAGTHVAVYSSETRTLRLRHLQGQVLFDEAVASKPEAVRILNARGNAMAWLEGTRLRLWRQTAGITESLVEGPCTMHGEAEASSALLICGDQSLYRADFTAGQVKTLGRLTEKPLAVQVQGDYLLLQYADHIEVRRGPRFDAFSWGYPCQLQDKVVLGATQAYLVNPRGGLHAFDLRSGQSMWQKSMLAQEVYKWNEGLLVLTMAHTLEALNEKGDLKFTYSIGWEGNPLLHLGEEQITLHFADSRRVRIDREGAKAAKRPGALLLENILAQGGITSEEKLSRLQKLLQLEPGNGDAWRHRYALDKQADANPKQLAFDLIQAARSPAIPAWSHHPVLRAMAGQIGAAWAFKREYGPKFYPTLVTGRDLAFYLESDNQTLVILDPVQGDLVNSYRFAEDLDFKAAFWRNDTLGISSATRLYLVSPWRRSGLLAQHTLPSPICQAISLPQGILLSDWQGHLRLMNPTTGAFVWERKLSSGGLLLGRPPSGPPETVDVTDLEGRYFSVQISSGKVMAQVEITDGLPVEAKSLPQGTAIALAQGKVLLIGRQQNAVLWRRDVHEQIFSLSGNRHETLVLTTANKRVICLRALDGGVISDQHLAAYLFNRPLVLNNSYWIGTTEPSLEQRNFKGERLKSHALTDLPGSPALFRDQLLLGTLDHLILAFQVDHDL
jgi:hypothetical protein